MCHCFRTNGRVRPENATLTEQKGKLPASRFLLYSPEDLEKEERWTRQNLSSKKSGHCPKCSREYASPYLMIPLTQEQEHGLFLSYRRAKIRQERERVKEQINIAKSHVESRNEDILCAVKESLDAQDEVDDRRTRFESKGQQEHSLRCRVVRVFSEVTSDLGYW